MNKRGYTSLIVITFFFILFMTFFLYKPNKITGYTVLGNNEIISVTLNGTKINSNGDISGYFSNYFTRYQKLSCLVEYQGNNDLSILFYAPGSTQPLSVYENINKQQVQDTKCETLQEKNICYAIYNVTTYVRGQWRCYSKFTNIYNQSNDFELVDQQPKLIRNIPNIQIDVNGTYLNQAQIKLNEYFIDEDGQSLTYAVGGNNHILVNINYNGDVTFTNPQSYQGYESITFRAYDGELGQLSNNISIKVGSGETILPQQCYSNWDCTIWDICKNGQQTRTCDDKNNCGVDSEKPIESRTCVVKPDEQIITQEKPKGKIEVEKPLLEGTTKTLVILFGILVLFGTLGFAGYLLYKKKNQNKIPITGGIIQNEKINETQPLEQKIKEQTTVLNLDELRKYIETMLNQRISEEKIKLDLLKAGWAKTDVQKALSYIKVKIFIDSKIKQGFDKQKIKDSLMAKGWKQQDIDTIFKELKL